MGARDLPEKLVKTGGTPFLSTFWPFLAKVAQTGEFLGPLGVQGIDETRTLLSGGELSGHLEGLFCTYCVFNAQIDPLGGL